MDIIYEKEGQICNEDTVVALGDFDGLHIAHMSIINATTKYAKENNLKSGVLIFEENSKGAKVITANSQKIKILKNSGIDFVYMRKFTKEFMQLSPREFGKLLVSALNVKAVCVGFDYRFGKNASGDVNMLKSLGDELGFEVVVTDEIDMDNKVVASSLIRTLISSGDVESANKFLGRDFKMEGKVIKGLQNGTKMGIPTANLDYDCRMILPKEGVYAGLTTVLGKDYKSVINVGKNPTFNADKLTIESHILDFNENIYDEEIGISFKKRLREDRKFNSVDELKEQINQDIKAARELF